KVIRQDPSAATDPWSQTFLQMSKAGGRTYFLGIQDIDTKIADIQKKVAALDTTGNQTKVMNVLRSVYRVVEDMNTVFENATRLSAFKVALDNGATHEQAASLAKNITV